MARRQVEKANTLFLSDEPEPDMIPLIDLVVQRLRQQGIYNRAPLFVLGAGISRDVVPLLKDIGWWLRLKLDAVDLPADYVWVREHAKAISLALAKLLRTSARDTTGGVFLRADVG